MTRVCDTLYESWCCYLPWSPSPQEGDRVFDNRIFFRKCAFPVRGITHFNLRTIPPRIPSTNVRSSVMIDYDMSFELFDSALPLLAFEKTDERNIYTLINVTSWLYESCVVHNPLHKVECRLQSLLLVLARKLVLEVAVIPQHCVHTLHNKHALRQQRTNTWRETWNLHLASMHLTFEKRTCSVACDVATIHRIEGNIL